MMRIWVPLLLPLLAGAVTITDHGIKVQDLPGNRRQQIHLLAIASDAGQWELKLVDVEQLDDAGKLQYTEATIGFARVDGPRHSSGWYGGDTFRISIDGTSLHRHGRWADTRVIAQGERALCEAVLEHPRGRAAIRLGLAEGCEGADLRITADSPKVEVSASAYPAFFTAWNKRRGHRWVVTPTRELSEPREGVDMDARKWQHVVNDVPLEPASDWWLFICDKFFNSNDGKGNGLCGTVYLEDDLATARLEVSDYHVRVFWQPVAGQLRLTLWQRNVRDWEPVLADFRAAAAAARARLTDPATFAPPALVDWDPSTPNAAVATAAVAAWRAGTLGEAAALAAVLDYRRTVWQARRAAAHPLRFLVLDGRHYRTWGVHDLAAREGWETADSYFADDWRGERLSQFPATMDELFAYDAVLMLNVGATPLQSRGRALLRDFVEAGGGLLVVGGFYSFGGGAFAGSELAPVLPVEVGPDHDMHHAPDGLPIDGFPGAHVYWYQQVAAKPAAEALWRAGDVPLLVRGTFGAGRVIAIPATVLGDPPAARSGFWQHPAWPDRLAAHLRWLCGQ